MALKAGGKSEAKPIPISGSTMVELMEKAFEAEWNEVMKKTDGTIPNKPNFNDQTRLLFVAVARGVVEHLLKNELKVTLKFDRLGGTPITETGILTFTTPP